MVPAAVAFAGEPIVRRNAALDHRHHGDEQTTRRDMSAVHTPKLVISEIGFTAGVAVHRSICAVPITGP
jgi:hypothetical protein